MNNINNLINNASQGQLAAIEEICLRINNTDRCVIKICEAVQDSGLSESDIRNALKLMAIAEIIEYRSRARAGNVVTVVDIETFNKLKEYFSL